jgi:FXSXX-COOH protein
MSTAPINTTPDDSYESALVDVTGLTLEQLRGGDDSVLTLALRRALTRTREEHLPLAAFQNQLHDDADALDAGLLDPGGRDIHDLDDVAGGLL